MVTRSQSSIVKPIDRLSLLTSSLSHIPKSPFLALNDPNWSNAMYDKYNTLVKNGTQVLVSRPSDVNLRSLYGLKQAPRAWFQHFTGYATRTGFSHSRCDSSLFIYTQGSQVAYLLIYVDDIILTASSPDLLQQIIDSLHKEFDMTDLGALNYFLGIPTVRHSTCLFLSQKKYALQLLEHAHMVHCNPSHMPVDTETKLGPDGVPVQDPTLYRNLAGGLQYLTFTHPDLSYAVQQICLYMHDPREPNFAALKRVMRYVKGTLDLGLHLYASATTPLVGYTDADWASCPSNRSAEVEYRGVANIVTETAWVRNLLPGHVKVLHVPSCFQYADIFTKGLPSALFEDFCSSLSVLTMEYLVNISKRHAFWSLNEDILKINDFDYQYAVSIKEDTAYPCLYLPKTTKERRSIRRIQRRPIRRIRYMACEYSGRYKTWSLLQETPIRHIQPIGYAFSIIRLTALLSSVNLLAWVKVSMNLIVAPNQTRDPASQAETPPLPV
ncbi:ribonuclease H-like domain-containing protein [Tanacetum coccineum]